MIPWQDRPWRRIGFFEQELFSSSNTIPSTRALQLPNWSSPVGPMSSASSPARFLIDQLLELRLGRRRLAQLRHQLLLPLLLPIALLPQRRQLPLQAPQPQPAPQR